jgi:hypothetical protein
MPKKMRPTLLWLSSLLAAAHATHVSSCTLHVERNGDDASTDGSRARPLATLHEAALRISGIHQDAAVVLEDTVNTTVVVCVGPGTHVLGGQALELNATHSHALRRVVWQGVPSPTEDGPPLAPLTTISGGAQLTKWYRCDDGVHCNFPNWSGVWVSPMSAAPPSLKPTALIPVRQLWVHGTTIVRTRVSLSGLGLVATSTGYTSAVDIPWASIAAARQAELRWPKVVKNWIEPRCVVTAASSRSLTVASECWTALIKRNGGKLPPPPVFVENINGDRGPPGPGQFFSTPEYLFYRPLSSSSPLPADDAWVGVQEVLLDGGAGITDHTFSNLAFSHATWRQPSSGAGYVPSQTGVTPEGEPRGSVVINGGRRIQFQACAFQNSGALYGLSVGGASQDIVIQKCRFQSLSGGAVKLGNVIGNRCLSTDPAQWDARMLLQRNLILNVSTEFRGAAAVFAGYVASTRVDHNTIYGTGYTAISMGWGWGGHVKGQQTFAHDNHVTGNHMSSIMQALNDGGCVYTLGPQKNSTVSGNYCSHDEAPVVGCFYHDQGSRYFRTTGNVAEGSPAPCVYLQGCCNSPAYDIYVADLWCKGTASPRNGCVAENCVIDESSLHTVGATAPWPAEAMSIIKAAGWTA